MKLPKLQMASKIVALIIVLFCIPAIAFSPYVPIASAKTVEQIIKEIEQKQSVLEDKEQELAAASAKSKELLDESAPLEEQLARVTAILNESQATLEATAQEINELMESIAALEAYIEEQKTNLGHSATSLYQMTQMSDVEKVFASDGLGEYVVANSLRQRVVVQSRTKINELFSQVELVSSAKALAEGQKIALEAEVAGLDTQRTELSEKVAVLRAQIAEQKRAASTIKRQISGLQSDIDLLEAEQKKILEEEARRLREAGNDQARVLVPGEYYFRVRGDDSGDGHGIGFSQFGAYGMGWLGWSYSQMLNFYYSSVTIKNTVKTTIPVSGHGNMNIETYVAGLGEVPDKACGTLDQVQARPDKYLVDNPNTVWDCWPEETIKAQVVAARSYAIYYTRTGKAICTTAVCQVYKGGTAKQWAADETAGKIVTHSSEVLSGNPDGAIGAFYSSSARGHTENNEYVWTKNKYGDKGYHKAYLNGVDDSPYAYKNTNYNKITTTNSYSLDQLSAIFATNSYTNVGNLISLSIERGVSPRVWRVRLEGSSGTKTVAGWYFKSVFNTWVQNNRPSGQRDYIRSTEFYFLKVE